MPQLLPFRSSDWISTLIFSSTSEGVEQTEFQSQVSLHGVELWPFRVRAPSLESNFRPPLFEHQQGSRTFEISKFSVPSWSRTFVFFRYEPQTCRRSFRVKIRGSKPEKLGFHLSSCNMHLLVNYTKYYTVAIFMRKSLIYIVFWRAWISVNPALRD